MTKLKTEEEIKAEIKRWKEYQKDYDNKEEIKGYVNGLRYTLGKLDEVRK